MKFFRLKNPINRIKGTNIAVREDDASMLIVDFKYDPVTGQEYYMNTESTGYYKGAKGAKIAYTRKYQSLVKGYERPVWEEASSSPMPAQGRRE